MKKNLSRIAFTLALCALLNVVALAGGKSRKVTFNEDVKVGDTLVKRGSYRVSFDEKSNELMISDGDEVIAKTSAHLEEHKKMPGQTVAFKTMKKENSGVVLLSVNMGDKFAVLGSEHTTGSSTTGQQ